MERITLKINGETDFEVINPMVTIGRGSDNTIALPEDPNVSLYHARIEQREDGFWLIDQGSSNGTTVNGIRLRDEILLQDGDKLLFGGSSLIDVEIEDNEAVEDEEYSAELPSQPTSSNSKEEPAKSAPLLLIAGAVVGLAVVFAAAAGTFYWLGSSKNCEASAKILNPDSGETITEPVDVELEVTNPQCVEQVVFVLGNKEFASVKGEPYRASLDPQQFPDDLADGNTYGLKVLLIDAKGNRVGQSNEVALAFEILEQKPKTPEPVDTPTVADTPKIAQNTKVGVIETQTMVNNLLKQFSGGAKYKLDQQFLVEVNKKSAEYVSEGYYSRALPHRDTINVIYVQEQNIDAPVGYILAMSRSKFNTGKQADGEGLWRISRQVLDANGFNYSEICGTESLTDATQKCSTKISALYLKSLLLNVFEGDLIFSIAAIGMPPGEASSFKSTLPPNREDFWKLLKSPKQREEVVRFFAAGIVAENPQKFGLKKDRPISELYKITMGN